MPIPTIDEWLLKKTADILDPVASDEQLKTLWAKCRLEERDGRSKRERIFQTLLFRQAQDGYPDHVLSFIRACMDPVRFRSNTQQLAKSRSRLNDVLAYAGYQLREDGKVWVVQTEQSKEMAEIRRSALEAVRRLCGDEVEARLRPSDPLPRPGSWPVRCWRRWGFPRRICAAMLNRIDRFGGLSEGANVVHVEAERVLEGKEMAGVGVSTN
jgi:hypothetical protein